MRKFDLDALLRESDYLTIHTSATEAHPIGNADRFSKMQPTALFVNCDSGPIVDEVALRTPGLL